MKLHFVLTPLVFASMASCSLHEEREEHQESGRALDWTLRKQLVAYYRLTKAGVHPLVSGVSVNPLRATINVGSDLGVETGVQFRIFRAREHVASINVDRVKPRECSGPIVCEISRPQVGDWINLIH